LTHGAMSDRANSGTFRSTQEIASHASPNTAQLYDRTSERIGFDEVAPFVI